MSEPRNYPHEVETRTPAEIAAEIAIDEFIATWAPSDRFLTFREAVLDLIDGQKYAYRFEVIAEVQHAFIAATSELPKRRVGPPGEGAQDAP